MEIQKTSPILSNGHALSDMGSEYRFHRCVRIPQSPRVLYITRLLAKDSRRPDQKCSVIGTYDRSTGSLASVVVHWPKRSTLICSITAWRDGVIMCGPEGITYMNSSSFKVSRLLSVEIDASGFRCLSDIAVLPYDNSIWFIDTDYSFHDATASKIYCFDPRTGRLHAAASDVEVPINIAFSADSSTCYISDAGSASIFAYRVVPTHSGAGYTLANRTRFAYTDLAPTVSLKTKSDGRVYAASENCIRVWSKTGILQGQLVTQEPVTDFFLQETTMTVMHAQSFVDVSLAMELDARL